MAAGHCQHMPEDVDFWTSPERLLGVSVPWTSPGAGDTQLAGPSRTPCWLKHESLRVITAPKADSECKIGATAASWYQIDKKSMHLKEK